MCGRMAMISDVEQVEKEYGVAFDDAQLKLYQKNYNTTPTSYACVIMSPDGHKQVRNMRWGLVPRWTKDLEDLKASTFNARSETIEEKPTFAAPFLEGKRCLVLANGYYEWRKSDKKPFYFTPKDGSIMAFAGLWDRKLFKGITGEYHVESCTIITCKPNDTTAAYHDRMPVILSKEEQDAWLSPDTPIEKLRELMAAIDDDYLDIRPVSKRVGNIRNNDPSLIEREAEQEDLAF